MSAPSKFLPHVDELVMEYLLFRGFTKTFQAFNVERKRDRTKGFDVDQIATQFLSHIQTYVSLQCQYDITLFFSIVDINLNRYLTCGNFYQHGSFITLMHRLLR